MSSHDTLFEAVRNADIQAVTDLLAADPSLARVVDDQGHTPLHKAAQWLGTVWILDLSLSHGLVPPDRRESSIATLQSLPSADRYQRLVLGLLDLGIPVDVRGSDGATPLHACAAVNAWNAAELLLSRGANIEARDDEGETPLHWAVRELDSPGFAMSLVERGADVNARSSNGMTPLHWAALGGKTDTVAELLDAGAEMDAASSEPWLATPLVMAIQGESDGRIGVVQTLLEHGADPVAGPIKAWEAAATAGDVPVFELLRLGDDGVGKGHPGELTALHFAAANGRLNMVRYLIAQGADPSATDGDGKTPASHAEARGHADVSAVLEEAQKATGTRVVTATAATVEPGPSSPDFEHVGRTLWPAIEGDPELILDGTFLDDLNRAMRACEEWLAHELASMRSQGHASLASWLRAVPPERQTLAREHFDACTEYVSGTGTRVLAAGSELVQTRRIAPGDIAEANRIMERAMRTAVEFFPTPTRCSVLGDFRLRLARAGVSGYGLADAVPCFERAIELDPEDHAADIARRRLRSIAENPANQTAAEPQQEKSGWLHRLRLLR